MKLLDLVDKLEHTINKKEKNLYWNNKSHHLVSDLVKVMLDFPEKPADFELNVRNEDEARPQYKKVILVSGGADSSIMWWLNKHEESKLGIYVDLGHNYVQKELDALENFGIDYKYIKHHISFGDQWKHIIPTRNFLLIAHAAEYVATAGEIWLGAVQGESSPDKGDKSDKFFRLTEQLILEATGKYITIKTLKDKTKNDWLKQYLDETGGKTDILETITCFDGSTVKPCGSCQACVRKWISLKYCDINTDGFFEVDPYVGGKEFIEKYKSTLYSAIRDKDYEHYSEDRAKQDLNVIMLHENQLMKNL